MPILAPYTWSIGLFGEQRLGGAGGAGGVLGTDALSRVLRKRDDTTFSMNEAKVFFLLFFFRLGERACVILYYYEGDITRQPVDASVHKPSQRDLPDASSHLRGGPSPQRIISTRGQDLQLLFPFQRRFPRGRGCG